jgi:bacterioferritin-associated ferredoxin
MVALVREIDKALSNPVWEQVRTPAPWDEVSWEQLADKANAEEAAANDAEAALAVQVSWTSRVCNCKEVDEADIEEAIRAHKLLRVDDVRACVGAGTGCGSCVPRIAAILQRINGVKVPAFEQTPIYAAKEADRRGNEIAAKTPSPQPSPARGEGVARACNGVPSPLVGEGQGEGEPAADLPNAPINQAA